MYKILVVDDEPRQAELMCIMLGRLNIECIIAYTGEEAVKLAKQFLPDVIIMDWILPAETLTGNDAVQQILSEPLTYQIPVIACSAVSERHQVMAEGCVDFVAKPFRLDTLLDTIRNYLP